jgi:hypothetical protein
LLFPRSGAIFAGPASDGPNPKLEDRFMHDIHGEHHGHHHHHGKNEHREEHSHEHEHAHEAAQPSADPLETTRLRKMVEHWISHNEDHAGSYRQWANRARVAGYGAAGDILEQVASEVVKQNEKFAEIIKIIDSST